MTTGIAAAPAAATRTSGAMTDHVVRLYAVAIAVLVFFVTWAAVAARPFAEPAEAKADPRIVQLQEREQRLVRRQARVQRIVERRFTAYRRELAERRRLQAALDAAAPVTAASYPAAAAPVSAPAAPAVQVTSAPPVTSSGSS